MPTLYFDISKFQRQQRHRSGLNRVSVSLQRALSSIKGLELKRVVWSSLRRSYIDVADGTKVGVGQEEDTFFTPETFALRERPFCRSWMLNFRGRCGVLFYDAIPYYHPDSTWPHSVRRFPRWFRDLTAYDRVMYISIEARSHAHEVHQKTGWGLVDGSILPLGANYAENPLERNILPEQPPVLLNIGIIEPRKGQVHLLEAAESLWSHGKSFKLVFLGRVNPHFGKDIARSIQALKEGGRPVIHEPDADDGRLAYWHQNASLVVLPTRAEGFGLPAVEALWAGCPVLATEHPSLVKLTSNSGVRILKTATTEEIVESLEPLLEDVSSLKNLELEIRQDELPRWDAAARHLVQDLGISVKP